MRVPLFWRLLVALLLVAGSLAVPIADHQVFVGVAQDDDDDDGGDDDGGEGDDDDGGEGDDDGDDGGDDDGGEGDDGGDDGGGDDGGDDGRDRQAEQVVPSVEYRVEVECATNDDAGGSECLFTIVEPAGGKKVTHILLPEATVCAEVIDGDFTYDDADPTFDASGYRAKGKGPLSLVLEGDVTAGGTATYWLKTGDGGGTTFGDLAPGTYDLGDAADNWCHAESDNVDAEGNVVVEAGQETAVWLFYCESGGS